MTRPRVLTDTERKERKYASVKKWRSENREAYNKLSLSYYQKNKIKINTRRKELRALKKKQNKI